MRHLLCLLALAASAQTLAPVPDHYYFEKDKLRVLILTGRNNHDWRTTTPFLRQILELSGRFDVRVTEEPAGLTPEVLKPYDLLVSNYCGPRWGAPAEAAVASFVRDGKGLVVVHAASYPFGDTAVLTEKMGRTDIHQQPWPEWGQMVGAVWSDQEPRTTHAQRHAYRVSWKDPSHPIAAGMSPDFLLSDELYHNFRLKPGIHVLASAFDDPKIGGNGKIEPLLWTNAFGRGRVFHTALGHDLDAMQSPGFVATYARGAEWAASGAVTLPTRLSLDPKRPNAARVLLVAGGHDHEASFYSLFEHNPAFRVNVDPHPVAFRHDLRKAYDVLVLYDTLQLDQLPEAHQKNLRDFVEAGKGLVILHHAIADFQAWPWWWRDVVGARYVLKAEPAVPAAPHAGTAATPAYPASSYLHDVEMVVTPTAAGKAHPITKGLPQMRVFDETYKGLWHAGNLNVLLTTDEKTSDEPLVWTSPYDKSRVAAIMLGHGRESHEQPWFRSLVQRAILWSAGR